MIEIRKGQAPEPLVRSEFSSRFRASFIDAAFRAEDPSISRLEEIAWGAYTEGRKAPFTQKAGPGYADPDYDLSTEWVATKKRLEDAQAHWAKPSTKSRVLLICGSARNDGTCPGEISKTFRMVGWAREVVVQAGIDADVLDLSLLTSDYGRNIHPCKGCASTAMPLCHWPCSCYPNHALNQTNDFSGRAPALVRIRDFAEHLTDLGLNATVRRNRGTDIDAACGQLRERVGTPTPVGPLRAGPRDESSARMSE